MKEGTSSIGEYDSNKCTTRAGRPEHICTQTEYTQNNESLEPRATRKICMKGHEVEEGEEEAGGGEVDKEEVQVQKEEVSKISKKFFAAASQSTM